MASTSAARIKDNSQSRRALQKQELRASILRAASEEFLELGYEGFSLRHVAERVGYTPTTIYLYFRDKDELLLETVREGFAAFDNAIQGAAQNPDPQGRLRDLGLTYFEFGLGNGALYRLMFMQRADFLMPRLLGSGTPDEELAAQTLDPNAVNHHVVAQELLVEAVRDGIESGVFADGNAIEKADALWAGVHGLTSLALSPLMTPDHARSVANELLDVLIRGLKK